MRRKATVTLSGVVLVLGLLSPGKLALYELSGAVSTLRNAVGERVILPGRSVGGPDGGILEEVRYRWNDKVGFFDLYVNWSEDESDLLLDGSGSRGLSPFEVMDVKVLTSER